MSAHEWSQVELNCNGCGRQLAGERGLRPSSSETRAAVRKRAAGAGWTHVRSPLGRRYDRDYCPACTATCRHCNGELVRCQPPHEFPACKGWKHIHWLSMPIGAHYCDGRSVMPSGEPELPAPAPGKESNGG